MTELLSSGLVTADSADAAGNTMLIIAAQVPAQPRGLNARPAGPAGDMRLGGMMLDDATQPQMIREICEAPHGSHRRELPGVR